jgi:hypothetical protein
MQAKPNRCPCGRGERQESELGSDVGFRGKQAQFSLRNCKLRDATIQANDKLVREHKNVGPIHIVRPWKVNANLRREPLHTHRTACCAIHLRDPKRNFG